MVNLDWAGIALVITAIGALVTNVVVAWRTSAKMDRTSEKVAVIEGHVNSEKTADSAKIAYLQKEIALRQHMLDEKDKVAGLLAQSLAVKEARIGDTNSAKLAAPAVEKVLDSIDENTAAIDANTKKTTKDVAEMKREKK